MKRLAYAVLWSSLALTTLGASAQISAATASATNVTGRWLGSFDIAREDGTIEPAQAILVLKQDGNAITGTAGATESKLDPLSDGHVDGNTVHFTLVVHQTVPVHFALKLEGDRLKGDATGLPVEAGSSVLVNVARWPEGGSAPEIIHAQDGLFLTVAALDTKLFNAYNRCDLQTLSAMVEDGLEFYHDKTGLTVGKQPFLDAIKSNICGKTQRTLVPGSLEVYPLKDYGAVEIGVHRFTHPAHPEEGVGDAKFITLWEHKDGTWKISRAISFDHQAAK